MEENEMSQDSIIKVEGRGISAGTIARTVCLLLALVNQVLAILGQGTIAIADDTVYQLVSAGFTIVTALIAWWKNNSFTQSAQAADEAMKKIKGK